MPMFFVGSKEGLAKKTCPPGRIEEAAALVMLTCCPFRVAHMHVAWGGCHHGSITHEGAPERMNGDPCYV